MLTQSHRDSVEIEMIRSLSDGFPGSVIMSAGFAASAGIAVYLTRDVVLTIALIAGLATSVIRLVTARSFNRDVARPGISLADAQRAEHRFAVAYMSFAMVLGIFGGRAMILPAGELHTLTMCLICGYAAGVAAALTLRPHIAIPSMLLAVVPAIVSAASWATPVGVLIGTVTSALLGGGIDSLCRRKRRAAKDIGMRLTLTNLAGKDPLTGLRNRFAFREWFDNRTLPKRADAYVAVHYLDLNGFKPVNDKFGHATGDVLLKLVGARLSRVIREIDIVSRLGGDEFAVVQCEVSEWDEAEDFAHRLAATVARPYLIDGHSIQISTSIGYVVAPGDTDDLERLLGFADDALYSCKRSGRAVIGHHITTSAQGTIAA